MTPSKLWGTYSVRDHLRPDAFIPDLLVYDCLVIPVPTEDDEDRWKNKHWHPEKQREILRIFEDEGAEDLVLALPWDEDLRREWHARSGTPQGSIGSSRRIPLAGGKGINADIDQLAAAGPDLPFNITAGVLELCVRGDIKHPLVEKFIARATADGIVPEPVIAYRSFSQARKEQAVGPPAPMGSKPQDFAYAVLEWPIDTIAENDLDYARRLKRTIAHVRDPDLRKMRRNFNGWVKAMTERSTAPDEALEAIKPLLSEMRELNRTISNRRKIQWVGRMVGLGGVVPEPVTATIANIVAFAIGRFLPVPEVPRRLHAPAYILQSRELLKRLH